MVATRVYPQTFARILAGEINWASETTLKVALMDATFAFNDTHDVWANVSASDYSSATGYTAGGELVTTPTTTETDSSTLTARANTTAYTVGDLVRTATDSGRVFLCVVAGTSAASEPGGMATLGTFRELTDGSAVWVNIGSAVTVLDGDAVSWTGLDQSATNAAVLYNDDGVNEPLIAYIDFEASETPTDLTITPPGEGYVVLAGGGAI